MTHRGRNPRARAVPTSSLLCTLFFVTACSTSITDPNAVGGGNYLQILQGSTVIVEMDTSNAGLLDCPHQAYGLIQQNASFAGRTKCSNLASTDPLPYSFRAHVRLNEGDEFKPSSPYRTRAATARLCANMRNATAARPKTVILEDHCGAVEPQKTPASAPAAT